ncbi:MAG: hypothetical protein WAL61_15275 [Acidimicrobiales bacterium]
MTRIFRSVGFVLALATAGLGAGALAWTSAGTASAQSAFTPLPPGWELCVLEGVTAPATAANVADLDEWQAAEGGSTNNTAAFNPFNSLRTTDATGAAIPGSTSANGFPAFPTWAAGCAATVATLFQPNMWVITAALRAGNVSPPAAFLAVVDQSAWCAPSPGGVPCYVNAMLSPAGGLTLAVPASSALDVYGSVTKDLQAYQQSIATVTADQNTVAERDLALAASENQVAAARGKLGAASRALQGFAISEYVNSGLYSGAPLVSGGTQPLSPTTPRDSDGVVAQQYLGVAATNLITHNNAAAGAFKGSEQRRGDAAKALSEAALTLTSDEEAENRDLGQLIVDVATLEHAGACATVTITPPPSSPAAATGSPGTSSTTTTTTVPPTTTTTIAPTTTTAPPTTSTTTTTVPTTDPPGVLLPTTTTTTSPPTTTTSLAPPTTTTTTTVPPSASPATGTAPPAEAAGVTALQGCIATFAPPANA